MKRIVGLWILLMALCFAAAAEGDASLLLNAGETLVAQQEKGTALAALVEDNASGCRCLRLLEQDGRIISSRPLSGNIGMDTYHSGPDQILLHGVNGTKEGFISIRRGRKGQWVCENVQLYHGYSIMMKQNSITDLGSELTAPGRNDAVTYGEWRIPMPSGKRLQDADFSMLPVNLAEAWHQLDTDVYAYVNNPDPSDRLHLRTRADKSAPSLGKFYNRTPVRVLERGDTWSLVYIGSDENRLSGYMMTKYLAFGDRKDTVRCAFPQLFAQADETGTDEGPEIYIQPYLHANRLGRLRVSADNYIIGVCGDEWLVVMTPEGRVGYCRASEFGEGNG